MINTFGYKKIQLFNRGIHYFYLTLNGDDHCILMTDE